MLKTPVILPIFIHTAESAQFDDLNIPFLMEDCDTKDVYFFNINAVSTYTDEDKKVYTKILSNGDEYVCPFTVNRFLKMISEANI